MTPAEIRILQNQMSIMGALVTLIRASGHHSSIQNRVVEDLLAQNDATVKELNGHFYVPNVGVRETG